MRQFQILWLLGLFLIVVFAGYFSLIYFKYDYYIADKNRLLNYKNGGIVLVDRNNKQFYSQNSDNINYIELSQIPRHMILAVVAAEDKEFFDHHGVSPTGIARAVILNVAENRIAYGGSTITQQLVKNTLLTPERSFTRKINETLLAFNVESKYSKEEIIEMYLNSIYYGEGAVGVHNAAKTYFNKDASELTLAQSAYLAGIIRFPRELSYFRGNIEEGKQAQERVLNAMESEGFISKEEKEKAINEDLAFERGSDIEDTVAPHFALMVLDFIKEKYGDEGLNSGYTVTTTLDLSLQKKAQETVRKNINNNRNNSITNGALVAIDPATGEILALVGSSDWFQEDGRINMALTPRQPGSSFKPIVYSLALDNGVISPTTTLLDIPKTYILDEECRSGQNCTYKPRNYDNSFRGKVSVRQALANSLNVPSVEVMDRLGIRSLLDEADSFGITSLKEEEHYGKGLSLVLGSAEVSPLEMALAYTTFANSGNRPDPHLVLDIEDKYGKNIYERSISTRNVISETTAFLISSILSDASARREEFGNILDTPFEAAVKTGTTENFKDAWTIGYTKKLVTAVWVGNSDSAPTYNIPGSRGAAPVWKEFMSFYRPNFDSIGFSDPPEGLVKVEYCSSASSSANFEYVRETRSMACLRPPDYIAKEDNELGVGGGPPTPTASPAPSPTQTPAPTLTPTP